MNKYYLQDSKSLRCRIILSRITEAPNTLTNILSKISHKLAQYLTSRLQIRFEHPVYRSSDTCIVQARGARDITGSLTRICTTRAVLSSRFHRPFFLPVSFFPSVRCYPRTPLSPAAPSFPPSPRPPHTVRAGALIMRGFRRSRFHSFLRLRHREMIIGT